MRRLVFAIAAILTLTSGAEIPAQTSGEKRVALVIGNGAYQDAPLRNPVNDARAMATALKSLGFDVITRENVTQKQMQRAIADFGRKLAGGGVGLFYYAGHGMQVGGKNYLIPVDATIESEADVRLETVDVDVVLDQVRDSRLNLVILDACRNNPFERRFRGGGRGLAVVEAPVGTMIAYATAPGKVANDGDGTNGLYTTELLKAMRTPGIKVEDVFKRVRAAVARQTRNDQVPWESSSLTGDFYFLAPGAAGQGPVASMPVPAPAQPTVTWVPRQEFGTLAITAGVAGVEVSLEDRRLGETRAGSELVVSNLLVGTYRLKAARTGYKTWEREVLVLANQRTEVRIDIELLRPESASPVKGDEGAEMVLVPAGEFRMGSDERPDERPRHSVFLDAYYIYKHEVTNAEYRRFLDATGRAAPSYWHDSKFNGPTQPVVGVTWHDAEAYCRWAGKRLPTEAEWEKAARGTDGRKYPWGEQWDASRANSDEARLGKPAPVGSYPNGVSPYGAHDMAGNVWEWVADWYEWDYYAKSPRSNPKGPDSGRTRVLRGGAWYYDPAYLSTAFRHHVTPDNRRDDLGFRCARESR